MVGANANLDAAMKAVLSAIVMLPAATALIANPPEDARLMQDRISQLLKPCEARIAEHRQGTIIVRATPGVPVKVTQLRHEFWFGTAMSRHLFVGTKVPLADRQKYKEVLKANFNCAVHENALKWYSTERTKGKLAYGGADAMLKWCEENDVSVRGHCVYWAVDKYVQDWIKQLDDNALRTKLEARARSVMGRYRGRIPEYDVNNEMVHGHHFEKRLGAEVRHDMFRWCRQHDPKAVLYVNDYGILTGGDLAKYEKQIAGFIKAGVPVGGIGLQGHFGARGVDGKKVKRVLDRLAKFKLPLKVTEFDINSDSEKVKAEGLVKLYAVCFAHPSVNGILMWGFWEGRHWRPKAAIWKRDWSPTPAAEAYRELVFNRWWTRFEGQTDKRGVCRVEAFFGKHRVEVGKRQRTVDLPKAEGEVEVKVQK